MGASFSRARKRRGQSSDSHLISAPTIPPFLDLPLDVLHCIFDHIEPGDAIAYTISCKTLYYNYFAKALKQLRVATLIQRQAVHLMLEKERPDTFYCHSCDALHCFDRQWRATGTFPCQAITETGTEPVWTTSRPPQGETYHRTMRLSGGRDQYGHRLRYPYKSQSSPPRSREGVECFLCPRGARGECPHAFCKLKSEFQPHWSPHMPYRVDYVLARLVMNRHLLGAQAGLPLECLEVRDFRRTTPYDLRPEPFVWTQTWRARIIKDELFLSAVHKYTQPAVGDKFACLMRTALFWSDEYRGMLTKSPAWSIGLCAHVFGRPALQRYLPCLEKTGPGSSIRDLFVPCQDEPNFCKECLTDFTTTIQWIDTSVGGDSSGRWSVAITTYHQLGRCRSPTDWKWAVAERCPRTGGPGHWRHQRSIDEHGPGSVRRQWEEIDG